MALLYQLATESNPEVIKETIKYHFGMLRADFGDLGAVLAARMTAEIPGGLVTGSPSPSPARTYYVPSQRPTAAPTAVPYQGYGYLLPIV